MIEVYKKIVVPGFVWGLLAGLLIIIQLYIKKALHISGPIIFIINCTVVISIMIASVFFYKRRIGPIGFTIARELSFFVYFMAATILLVFRGLQGYFDKFTSPVILFGPLFIYGLGRILSYMIGMKMYNLKSDK